MSHNRPQSVRPPVVRKIALWWQARLDRAAEQGELPSPPPHREVIEKFNCTEEEAIRGVGLGEHRHFSGTE